MLSSKETTSLLDCTNEVKALRADLASFRYVILEAMRELRGAIAQVLKENPTPPNR